MQTVLDLDALDDDALATLYDYPPTAERAVVRASFVTSLDGSATGPEGVSGALGGDADRRVFELLRAECDVVLVGSATARAEGYRRAETPSAWHGLRERLGLAPAPTIAVVSGSLDLPEALLEPGPVDAGGLVVVTHGRADADPVAALRERLGADAVLVTGDEHGDGEVDVADAVEQLAARGLRRISLEGGPGLFTAAVEAGVLDELCLTLAPDLVGGDGPRIAGGRSVVRPMRLAHLALAGDVLLGRWTR
ncbi:dihydrofolate reductase family protein [Angustibacter aerolatus]